ncbi:MAG: hypothetical protein M3011_07930 [Actinomycetota bacterium]|nr:hypothetical protein [Actinomycetota bacterium]
MTNLAPVGGRAARAGRSRSGRAQDPPRDPEPDEHSKATRYNKDLLGLGAAAGLAMMVVTSTGDVMAAGVLLGLMAGDLAAGAIGVLAGIAVIGRWGSSSFAALAGGQAVVGAAGWSGPPGMVLSSWAAAAAVLLVVPRRSRRPGVPTAGSGPKRSAGGYTVGVVACGCFAAALVAGPAVGRDTDSVIILRVAASVIATAGAMVIGRACPRPLARTAGLIAAVVAAATAVLA